MGICSRKQADRLIARSQVWVNDQPAKLGMLVESSDQVRVNGELVEKKPAPAFLLYYKPVGVVCTHDEYVTNNIEQAIDYPHRVFAVGRLDKESEGLLLLTNQGDIVNRIMRAENKHEKIYQVWVDQVITDDFITKMAGGVDILNTRTLPCRVEKMSSHCFRITLVQGLNRQIRRMCKELGYKVERLQRMQIMDFSIAGLDVGHFRHLSEDEVERLYSALQDSRNEVDS